MSRLRKGFNLVAVYLVVFFSLNASAKVDQNLETIDEEDIISMEYEATINNYHVVAGDQINNNIVIMPPFVDLFTFTRAVAAKLAQFESVEMVKTGEEPNVKIRFYQSNTCITKEGWSTYESLLLLDPQDADPKKELVKSTR